MTDVLAFTSWWRRRCDYFVIAEYSKNRDKEGIFSTQIEVSSTPNYDSYYTTYSLMTLCSGNRPPDTREHMEYLIFPRQPGQTLLISVFCVFVLDKE